MDSKSNLPEISRLITTFCQENLGRKVKKSIQDRLLVDPIKVFVTFFDEVKKDLPIVKTPVRLCCKPFQYYFYCRTCCNDVDTGVCENCFNEQFHEGHNYIKVKHKGEYCDCGMYDRWDHRVFCKSHGSYSNTILEQVQQKIYESFVVNMFEIISNIYAFDKEKRNILKLFYNFLEFYNNFSMFYINLTTRALKTKAGKKFIEHILKFEMHDYTEINWSVIFQYLANSDDFLEIFFEILFTTFSTVKEIEEKPRVKSFFDKFSDTLRILNKLADRGILAFHYGQANSSEKISFYVNICQRLKSNRKGTVNLLPSVWKCLLDKNLINFHIVKKKNYITILSDAIQSDCFPAIVKKFIIFLVEKKESEKYFIALNMNSAFEFILQHLEGEEGKLLEFFNDSAFTKNEVERIIKCYLEEVISSKHYSHMHNFVFKAFIQLSKFHQIDLNGLCESEWNNKSNQLTHKIVTEIVGTFLGKFISNYEKNLIFLYKCVKSKPSKKQKEKEYEQELQKWFRRHLFSIGESDKVHILRLKDKGLLDFPGAKQIMKKETVYNRETYSFKYIGPEQKYDSDLLIRMKEPFGIKFGDHDGLFSTPERKEIFRLLVPTLYEKLNEKEYTKKCYIPEHHYSICLRAVVLDKILQGEDPHVHKFCLQMKKFKPSSPINKVQIEALFSMQISKTEISIQTDFDNESSEIGIQNSFTETVWKKEIPTYNEGCCQAEIVIKEKKEEEKVEEEDIMIEKKEENVSLKVIEENEEKIEAREKKEEKQAIFESPKSKADLMKQKKMAMIKERFMKKSTPHLNKIKPEEMKKEDLQCLICKDSTSSLQNPLFYCGTFRRDRFSNIFCRNMKIIGNYFMSSCFHPIHINCLPKNREIKCPLCGHKCDIYLPILSNETMSAGQIRGSLENIKLQFETALKRTFTIPQIMIRLLKGIINKNGISQLWGGNSHIEILYVEYSEKLIKNFASVLSIPEIHQIEKMMTKLIEENCKSENRPIVTDLQSMIARAILEKMIFGSLRNVTYEDLSDCIDKIRQKFNISIISGMLKKLYFLMNKEIDFELKQGRQFDKWEQFLDEIDLPEDAFGLIKMRKECQQCHLFNSIFCIQCHEVICKSCSENSHKEKSHQNQTYLILDLSNGTLKQYNRYQMTKAFNLYENDFKECFYPEAVQCTEFILNKNVYLKALSTFLKN